MKGVTAMFHLLVFLGIVHADSGTSLFNISSGQKFTQSIQMSLSALNVSEIPAWVNEWKAPKIFQKIFPFYKSGYDFDGSPVYVMEFGKWKVAEALRTSKDGPEKTFDLFVKYLDQSVYSAYRDGMANNAQGLVAIMDYDGFGVSNYASPLGFKFGLRQLATLDHRLNKVLNYAFFINVNFAAENMMRLGPLLGNILEKCEIFGTQKYKWLPYLARKIPIDQLP